MLQKGTFRNDSIAEGAYANKKRNSYFKKTLYLPLFVEYEKKNWTQLLVVMPLEIYEYHLSKKVTSYFVTCSTSRFTSSS